jgi:signal transduction histidine kinase
VAGITAELAGLTAAGAPAAEIEALMRANQDVLRLSQHHKQIQTAYSVYERVDTSDAATRPVIASTNSANIGRPIEDPDHTCLAEALADGSAQNSPVTDHRSIPIYHVCRQISGPGTEVAAVLLMEVQTEDFIDPLLVASGGGATGETLLVDRSGTILTSLKHPLQDGSIAIPLEYVINAAPARLAAAGREGIVEAQDYGGVPVLAAYRFIAVTEDRGWGMVVKQDLAEALEVARLGVVVKLVLSGIGVIGAITLILVLTNALTGPPRALGDAARRLGSGDLGVRAAVTIRDEVGDPAVAFNEMTAAVAGLNADLRERAEQLRSLNETLEQRVARRTADLERSNTELEQFANIASHDLQEPMRIVPGYTRPLRHRRRRADAGSHRRPAWLRPRRHRRGGDAAGGPGGGLRAGRRQSRPGHRRRRRQRRAVELPEVQAGEARMVQLLQNLIGNGIKFATDRPPRVRVDGRRGDGGWWLEVADNGVGIEERRRERIFEIFRRLHGVGEYSGTGMGLAICKRIVELHQRLIEVDSTPGAGSTFRVFLPDRAPEIAAG